MSRSTSRPVLSILILTRNEERNITKCLRSVAPLGAPVFVLDSMSQDRTVEIAASMGAVVRQRAWTTYSDQFNWGLDHCGIDTDWVMRLDADEEVLPNLVPALRAFLQSADADIAGAYVRRRMVFMGRWIRYGGMYPVWMLRVFRLGRARCEALMMDEHMIVSGGRTIRLDGDIVDRNDKDLTFWTAKHNDYATRELQDVLQKEASRVRRGDRGQQVLAGKLRGTQEASKRWLKDSVYLRLPLFVRPLLYFGYRYFLRFGFLDGQRGLIYHFLQAFWYRFLVDAKILEHRLNSPDTKAPASEKIRQSPP
jgi:glycosyltransferase involved in cell wall biosynthesis